MAVLAHEPIEWARDPGRRVRADAAAAAAGHWLCRWRPGAGRAPAGSGPPPRRPARRRPSGARRPWHGGTVGGAAARFSDIVAGAAHLPAALSPIQSAAGAVTSRRLRLQLPPDSESAGLQPGPGQPESESLSQSDCCPDS
jgi:hypothetical protein